MTGWGKVVVSVSCCRLDINNCGDLRKWRYKTVVSDSASSVKATYRIIYNI